MMEHLRTVTLSEVPSCDPPSAEPAQRLLPSIGVLPWIGLAGVVVWAGYCNLIDLERTNAWQGFSPLHFVYEHAEPNSFAQDFDNGISHLEKSAFMRTYLALNQIGVPPEVAQPLWICFFTIALVLAFAVLLRALCLRPSVATTVLTAVMVLNTSILDGDLTRFGFANLYIGQMYAPAAVLMVLALAWVIRQRWIWAGAALGLLTWVHVSLGVMTGVVSFAMILAIRPPWLDRRLLAGAGLCGGLAVSWVFGVVGFGGGDRALIDADTWIAWARFGNYHWFTWDLGVMTQEHARRLTPLLAVLLLALSTVARDEGELRVREPWLAGVGAASLLVCVGLWGAAYSHSPFLIRLSPHRASTVVLVLALPLAVHGLMRSMERGTTLTKAVAMMAIAVPVFGTAMKLQGFNVGSALLISHDGSWGFPLVAGLYFALPLLVGTGSTERHLRWVLAAACLISVVYGAFVVRFGYADFTSPSLWSPTLFIAFLSVALGIRIFPRALKMLASRGLGRSLVAHVSRGNFGEQRVWYTVLGMLVVVSCFSQYSQATARMTDETRAIADSYREVQEWAKRDTKIEALFLVDPTIAYGWRDYSHRSSFGTTREWLHTSWLYAADAQTFAEGLRRARLLGLEPESYVHRAESSTGAVYGELIHDSQAALYQMTTEELMRLAKQEGIDYVVAMGDRQSGDWELPRVFQNTGFTVYATR